MRSDVSRQSSGGAWAWGSWFCAILAALYFAGSGSCAWRPARPQPSRKLSVYVSPQKTPIISEAPGKDEGHALVPVYPTPPGGPGPRPEPVKLWMSPMDSPYIRKSREAPQGRTWCPQGQHGRRRPPPPRPGRPKGSARSNTGWPPWTPPTSGTSRGRPPAAWTWCRFMRRRGRRPRAPSRSSPATIQSMGVTDRQGGGAPPVPAHPGRGPGNLR